MKKAKEISGSILNAFKVLVNNRDRNRVNELEMLHAADIF
jgi:hypothetical protein